MPGKTWRLTRRVSVRKQVKRVDEQREHRVVRARESVSEFEKLWSFFEEFVKKTDKEVNDVVEFGELRRSERTREVPC